MFCTRLLSLAEMEMFTLQKGILLHTIQISIVLKHNTAFKMQSTISGTQNNKTLKIKKNPQNIYLL